MTIIMIMRKMWKVFLLFPDLDSLFYSSNAWHLNFMGNWVPMLNADIMENGGFFWVVAWSVENKAGKWVKSPWKGGDLGTMLRAWVPSLIWSLDAAWGGGPKILVPYTKIVLAPCSLSHCLSASQLNFQCSLNSIVFCSHSLSRDANHQKEA